MRKFYLIAGLLILIVVAATAKEKIYEYLAQVDGEVVVVKLTKLPEVRSRRGSWVDFEYKGKTFSTKRLPWSEIEQYEKGDQIPMKTYRDSEEFIPIGYSAKGELFAFTIAVFVGIICIYKGFKKEAE